MKTPRRILVSAAVLASVLIGVPTAGAGGVDEFEPNSKRDLAMQIFAGRPQFHTIDPDGDEDWIMFVPRRSGRYVLQITNVTVDLEGELWIQTGRDKEERVEEFEVPRGRDGELILEVDSTIGYFKLKIEADDDDDVGSYGLSLQQVGAFVDRALNVRRPDVFESDNRREIAVGILYNTPQLRTIYPRDDEDWLVFVPDYPGEYLLEFSNVTTDLKGELWVRRGDDKERRIDKFDVSRRGRIISLHADQKVRYFKICVEADDDETGDYRLEVVARSIAAAPTVLRTTVIRPTLRTPPIYRHESRYRYRYPSHYGRRAGIIPRILKSLPVKTGKAKIRVGVGRPIGIAPTRGRSKVTVHGGRSRSGTATPSRGTPRTRGRSSSRTTVRTPIRTDAHTTVRTPGRTPTRTIVRTPTPGPARTAVRRPGRSRTPTRTAARATVRMPSRTNPHTTVRTRSRTPTRASEESSTTD